MTTHLPDTVTSPVTTVRGHILLVEDDDAFREALARTLQREGYVVCVAPDFRDALEILESEQRIDLLLTDIVMPDRVNGVALSRMARLRRQELKVVYMTAYNIPGIDREALGPILRKPIEDDVLLREIEKTLTS